jgi:putative ABC transport system substrate-binding protein
VISRRRFVQGAGVAGLGLLAGCGRLPGQAATRTPRVGYVAPGEITSPLVDAFRDGLRELGYVEGQNVILDLRGAGGEPERYPAIAAELARLQPDVIVSQSSGPIQSLQHETMSVPVVFTIVSDPVGLGLVQSLAHPGGNVTGLSGMFSELSAKRLELLTETVPAATRVAVLRKPNSPAGAMDWKGTQDAAQLLGVELRPLNVDHAEELSDAFDTLAREPVAALLILADPLFSVVNSPQLAVLVEKSGLPVMHINRADVAAGALMSYGVRQASIQRRAAYYVDRILKGAKPADLPVEQPREFDFVINLKTAQAIGVTIPQHVLLQATEIIQ